MNKKGALFSLDLVFAVVLFVLLLGVLYQTYSYSMHQYNILKSNIEFTSYIDYIENKIALNKEFSCELVNNNGDLIKYISYCINLEKFNKASLNLPDSVGVSISGINFDSDSLTKNIEKTLKVIMHSGQVTKAEYYNCVMGGTCNLEEKEIVIGVGYK
jgi:hypothetical protein